MRPEPRSADPLSENLRHPGQAPDGTVVLHRPTPFLSSDSTAADYDAWPLGSPPQAANRSRHHPAALAIRPNRWARNDAGANAGRPHPPGRLRAQAPSFSAASQTGRALAPSDDGSAWCHSAASRSPGQWTRRKRKPGLVYPDRLPTFGFRLVGHLTHMGQLGIFFFLLASLLLSEIGLVLLFLTRAFLLAARLFGRHGCLRDVYITRI